MFKTNTDKFWEDVDNVINDAINEITNYVATLPNKNMEYSGIVEHDLRANYVYIDDADNLMVNYNYEEEMRVMHLTIEEILNLHDEIPNEF